jgi:hypothetical protein
VHALEGLACALHQDADAVDHGIDAPDGQEPGPIVRGLLLHEIHAQHALAVRQPASGFHHVVVARPQGMDHRAANATGGTTEQDSHVVLPCKGWMGRAMRAGRCGKSAGQVKRWIRPIRFHL